MDFAFNSEQIQLADALRRYVEKSYDFETRKTIVRSDTGTSDAVWSQLVELGVTALAMPEDHGGFGGGAVDLIPVMGELGRGLVAEPVLPTLVGAAFLKDSATHAALLAGVADGSLKLAVALGEADTRYAFDAPSTTASQKGGDYVLDGRKTAVAYGAQADHLVVSARLASGELALFLVDATSAGVTRRDARVLDGQRVAEVVLSGATVPADALLARGKAAQALLDRALDFGIALVAAEAVGVMEALNAATLEYAKTRKQFGQPIARFQVLQHRMVDMFVHLEQARSMAWLVAARVDADDAVERRRVASAAKVRIGQAARYIGQQAVQIHGGMGVTDELPAAHLFKRLAMIEMTFGDTDHHLQRFVAASQDAATETVAPKALRAA